MNHIDCLKHITSKTGLIRSMKNYYTSCSLAAESRYNVFDSIATSFILEVGKENEEYLSFLARFKELGQKYFDMEHMPRKHCEQNFWLLKPANMNQGRGIEVIRNLKEFKLSWYSKPSHSIWVIQKYIEQPMLYYGRKFDIRIWVLLTDACDIFFYKDGYIRTSSEPYNLKSSENYVHLTNNCLQVHGRNYSKHEPENTLSFSTFKEYLVGAYKQCKVQPNFDIDIIPRIKDLIIDTIMSIKPELISPSKKRGATFELLGYDFMIDEDLRTWLIEVNTNPYIGIPNDYIKEILPKMLDSMLNIVLRQSYPNNISDENDRFELIYCEKNSHFSKLPVNKRRSFTKNLIYPLKELELILWKRP